MSEPVNNTPVNNHDIAVECSKVRKCGWKGMESDMNRVPHKTWAGAVQYVCPKCGCNSYYRREVKS